MGVWAKPLGWGVAKGVTDFGGVWLMRGLGGGGA